ncbi:MAG TPA: hypothetical protein PLQ56_14475 [Aggregatilineales bacterium]|jgi:hypothetical protein|nr:hypothetical protein [Anaerolineae bacterium]HUN07812.1 hypothetical protein [Aggregatilineales bacterium]
MEAARVSVSDEVYRFMVSAPTPEQIMAFRVSEPFQKRASELLRKNKTNQLTAEEQAELDEFEQISHMMTMLKIYAEARMTKPE